MVQTQGATKDTTYNGWKNYQTWGVKLWLDNDEGSQEMQREALAQAKMEKLHEYWNREQTTRYTLADILKDTVQDMMPDLGASMFADLLGSALDLVDWNEIAENIMSDEGC